MVYYWCQTLAPMRDIFKSQPVYTIRYYGHELKYNAQQILQDKYIQWCADQVWTAFILAAIIAAVVCVITFFVTTWILGHQGKQQSEDEITGGRQLTDDPKAVAKMLRRDGLASDIKIGELPLIKDSEIQNFCLHGTVGAGKSEVIRRLMNYARQRGDMVIVYDRSCEFVKSYYDPATDKILNPLDARCAAWDLWRECLTQPDFDNVSNTLIPMMGYSFTSPEVVSALVRAKRRGVDVKIVLDEKGNRSKASQAAMNIVVNAGIPLRTNGRYAIMHDKVIIVDNHTVEAGSFNYTRSAASRNSENVLVINEVPEVAQTYLQHWQSRWDGGTDWHSSY